MNGRTRGAQARIRVSKLSATLLLVAGSTAVIACTDDVTGADGFDDPQAAVTASASLTAARKANLANFESYRDSDSACGEQRCPPPGEFAFVEGTQPESWVRSHNIVAVHARDAQAFRLKTLRLRKGSRQIDAVVYDRCFDGDCNGCCTRNANRGGLKFLVEVEKYTMRRLGSGSGTVEFTCLDCE
jgi:hypothetical protein